jgi:hypothetical protein
VKIPASRNPRLTANVNPFLTGSLNPRLTSSLNPKRTSSINPRLTASLNPQLTPSINPNLSSSINYKLTASRNPALTASINPDLTSSLNPNLTSNIKGLYIFDIEQDSLGFTVIQSDSFWLIFDPGCAFTGVAILVRQGFFNLHDLNNQYYGYLIHARGNSWLEFDDDGDWVGFTT